MPRLLQEDGSGIFLSPLELSKLVTKAVRPRLDA